MSYLANGAVLGDRYEVEKEIGRGGHSVVYLGYDRLVRGPVALKLLVPPPATADTARERMRREVQAVRELAHQHIVQVYDFLEAGPWYLVVMEYVQGPTLARRVRDRGPLEPDEAASLGRAMADALSTAHRRGILHRDVKPENILLGADGRARLTDFGSARLDGQTSLTATGGVVGTLDYLAPERFGGDRGDARSDIYSLGLTLYFGLTGALPPRSSPHLPPATAPDGHRPSRHRPGIPDWLDDAVATATAALPADRFSSAALLSDALSPAAPRPAARKRFGSPILFCLLCGVTEPLGLGLCAGCAALRPTGRLVAVGLKPTHTEAEVTQARHALRELLGPRPSGRELVEAVRGHRALVRVPEEAVERVIQRLADHGLSGRAAGRWWVRLPIGVYLTAALMSISGLVAGVSALPDLLWVTPCLVGLVVLEAQRRAQRPLLVAAPGSSAFSPRVRDALAATVARLPDGTALSLLANLARSAQAVHALMTEDRAGLRVADELDAIMLQAAELTRDLGELEDALLRLEQLRDRRGVSPADWNRSVVSAERTRDALVQRLLDTASTMAQLRIRLVESRQAPDELGQELGELTAELRQDVAAYTEAVREAAAAVGGTAAA